MAQEWHYAKGEDRHGPVSFEQLKQLAESGELQPGDLVWQKGLKEWQPAKTVKGLFPDESVVESGPPPVTQQTASTGTGSVPALWNPKAARAWSLLFTWGFGAFLLARNWKALGDEARAKRSMYWFYSAIAFVVLAFLTPDSSVVNSAFRMIGLAILAAWATLDAPSQIKLLKQKFNDEYPRKTWGRPIGIAAACLVVAFVGLLAFGPSGAGTITFAENVDPNTFETTNEGTVFSTGWVAMVIRGTSVFGDTRLIVSYRKEGESTWQILDEHTVDPEWDAFTVPVGLVETGDYDIIVKTGSGDVVAQNSVQIVPPEDQY